MLAPLRKYVTVKIWINDRYIYIRPTRGNGPQVKTHFIILCSYSSLQRSRLSNSYSSPRPCSSQIFHAWESLLQEVEIDSQIHADVAGTLNRHVSRPLIEKTFFRKIQSRKVFTHRESFDTILAKTEDMLKKVSCKGLERDLSDNVSEYVLQKGKIIHRIGKRENIKIFCLNNKCSNLKSRFIYVGRYVCYVS